MKNFITSDLHFSHKNIPRYCPWSRGQYAIIRDGVYEPNLERMNQDIVANFNSMVSEEDHTYILGDVGFCQPHEIMEYLKEMNGTKTIIHGNHDRKLVESSVFKDPYERRQAGIVEDTPYKVISVKVNGQKYGVVLFHYTIENWDGAHHGSVHLYGHAHGGNPPHPGRAMDIGIDTNNLYPYNLENVVSRLITKPPTYVGHHDGTRE